MRTPPPFHRRLRTTFAIALAAFVVGALLPTPAAAQGFPVRVEVTANPERVAVGTLVRFQVKVWNEGSQTIQNVDVVNTLPAGFQLRGPGSWSIGYLSPGKERAFIFPCSGFATRGGTYTSTATARAGGRTVSASCEVTVGAPQLTLTISCSRSGGPLDGIAEVVLTNLDQPKTDLRIECRFDPRQITILDAGGGGGTVPGTVTFGVGDLGPRQNSSHRFRYRIKESVRGDVYVSASALSGSALLARNRYRIQVVGSHGEMLCEVTEGVGGNTVLDRVPAGSSFYYLLTLRNESSNQMNLRLVFTLPPEVNLDASMAAGFLSGPNETRVMQTLRAEPLSANRFRILFPGYLRAGTIAYLKIPAKAMRATATRPALMRADISWVAHDPATGVDTGRFGEVPATDTTWIGAAAVPAPAQVYPELRVRVQDGKDGSLVRENFRVGEPFYYLVTLENRTDPLLDIQAFISLGEGIEFDSSRSAGLVSDPFSTRVLMPLELKDVGDKRLQLAIQGGLKLLGRRTAHLLVPVKGTVASQGRPASLKLDLQWSAYGDEGARDLNQHGDFTISESTWITGS